jgi:hypothetical protein
MFKYVCGCVWVCLFLIGPSVDIATIPSSYVYNYHVSLTGFHDPPDACICTIRLLHVCCMIMCVCVWLVCRASVVLLLITLANSQRGPVLLPSLEKGGPRPVAPPSLVPPIPLQRPRTAVRGRALGRSSQDRGGVRKQVPKHFTDTLGYQFPPRPHLTSEHQ